MGKSCTNESARILATRAGMTGVPCFEKRFDLTHAGILPTIPALSTCGLLKHTGRFAGVTGYYTTEQVFIVLGFLALLISPEVRKSEGHICICFTAYTVLLELERMLKKAKSDITVKRAQELTKNMYQLTYRLPKSGTFRTKIMNMDAEQQLLYDMVVRWVAA